MAKNIRYIIVDAGKNTVKFSEILTNGKIKSLGSFPARYSQGTSNVVNTNVDYQENVETKNFQVVYKGEHFVLGEHGTFYCNFNSKKHPIHRLCAYTAIGNIVDDGDTIHLIIGSTYNYAKSDDDKKELVDFYKDRSDIDIIINRVQKKFKIFDVSVYPEGLALILRMLYRKHDIQVGFDIGGSTIDVYNFESTDSEYLTSDNSYGINVLYKKLARELSLYARNIRPTEQDFLDIIKKSSKLSITLTDEQLNNLNQIVDSFVGNIINLSLQEYTDYRKCLLYSGGSSIVLKDRIIEGLVKAGVSRDNILFANSPFDNVFSYGLSFLREEIAKNDMAKYAQIGKSFSMDAVKLEKEIIEKEELFV